MTKFKKHFSATKVTQEVEICWNEEEEGLFDSLLEYVAFSGQAKGEGQEGFKEENLKQYFVDRLVSHQAEADLSGKTLCSIAFVYQGLICLFRRNPEDLVDSVFEGEKRQRWLANIFPWHKNAAWVAKKLAVKQNEIRLMEKSRNRCFDL